MNRKVFFFLITYPTWDVGSLKYQTLVYEYLHKKYNNVYVYGFSKIQQKYKYNKFFKLFYGIYLVLRIPRRSVLVMNNAFYQDYLIPLIFNKLWKKHVYFLIIHDLSQKTYPKYLKTVLENYFIRNTHGVTVSNAMKNELVSLDLKSDNIQIIPPGLDLECTTSEKIFPKKPKLLYVGSIEQRKGIIYLIEALKFVSDKDFVLNIVGIIHEKFYYNKIVKLIKELNLQDKIFFRDIIGE